MDESNIHAKLNAQLQWYRNRGQYFPIVLNQPFDLPRTSDEIQRLPSWVFFVVGQECSEDHLLITRIAQALKIDSTAFEVQFVEDLAEIELPRLIASEKIVIFSKSVSEPTIGLSGDTCILRLQHPVDFRDDPRLKIAAWKALQEFATYDNR